MLPTHGVLPLLNNNKSQERIKRGAYTVPGFVSAPARDLIRKLLRVRPGERCGVAAALRHRWLALHVRSDRPAPQRVVQRLPPESPIISAAAGGGFGKKRSWPASAPLPDADASSPQHELGTPISRVYNIFSSAGEPTSQYARCLPPRAKRFWITP